LFEELSDSDPSCRFDQVEEDVVVLENALL